MSSVPNGCTRLGADSLISGWGSSGSYGASTSAKIAIRTITTRSAAEKAPSGFFFIVRHSACTRLTLAIAGSSSGTWSGTVAISSLVPDPRIEPCVSQIDEQVQGDQGRRDQHHVGLHDGIVAVQDPLHLWQGPSLRLEDLLDDERPRQQRPELAADDRDDRDQRI